MVDQPDDVPPLRRRSTSLPPFIAPLGTVGARDANRPADAPRTPSRTPTRLFTPPRAAVHTARPVAHPYAPPGGDADTAPAIAPVPPATTPDAGDSGLNSHAPTEDRWTGVVIGVEADHDRDVAAWDAERADGRADAGGAEGTVGAERVDGHIGANGTAECMEQAADTTDDEVFGGDVYAAEEPFVEAAGSDAAVADEDGAAPEYAVTPEHANAREYADTHEYAVHHEYAERQEPEVSDASNSLAGECSTRHGLAAASEEDDDWFADVDEETPASAFDTPTATLEPALFQGLGDLERLGPASQPDPAPAPMDSGAGGGLAAWPEPDSRSTVAEALERVAVRIRDGDVPLPSDVPSASEEAALAAVLAALLHSRSR